MILRCHNIPLICLIHILLVMRKFSIWTTTRGHRPPAGPKRPLAFLTRPGRYVFLKLTKNLLFNILLQNVTWKHTRPSLKIKPTDCSHFKLKIPKKSFFVFKKIFYKSCFYWSFFCNIIVLLTPYLTFWF